MQNCELAKMIYHKVLSNMKATLDLEEFSFRDSGREDPRFKTFKRHLMSNTYQMLRELFHELEEAGLIEKTADEEDVKNGYKEGPSGGSGHINTAGLNKLIEKLAR